jgi:DNA-directed RNA polymerase beta' subunit
MDTQHFYRALNRSDRSVKRLLTSEEIEFMVDFIEPRPNLPKEMEESIVKKKKEGIMNQLKCIKIYETLIPELKEEIHRQYVDSIICPGECVGIIGAQSMGEFSTQATLNTFHVAGVDTGSSSGISRYQDLISASKTSKVETLSLYFRHYDNERLTGNANNFIDSIKLSHLRSVVSSKLTEVKLSHLVTDSCILYPPFKELEMYKRDITTCLELYADRQASDSVNDIYKSMYCLKMSLSKQLLFKHRLHPSTIKKIVENFNDNCKCVFLPMSNNDNMFFVFMSQSTEYFRSDELFDLRLCGVEGIIRYDFKKIFGSEEWFVETKGGNFNSINCLSDIFDLAKTKTTSMWDIYNTFGIEATKQFLIQELKAVMDGVDICHIKLLVERMTYAGTIKPITRYTMRNDESPLSRASFEESFETFIKASKYNEVEPFNGVSASVIGGKKAEVGTYMCDILVDLDKLLGDTSEEFDTIYEEDEELIYVD